jgi:ATP synthase protein I
MTRKQSEEDLQATVASKASRKLKEQDKGDRSIWFGIGTFGLIGWSIALPTLLGALGGMWIDRHFPGARSWTLVFLVAGLVLGCAQAWRWISGEEKKIRKGEDKHD